MGDGKQILQVDLGSSIPISDVGIWRYNKDDRTVMNEIIEISDDVNFNTGVTQLFNNDIANVWDRGKATQAEVDAEIKALNAVRAKLEYSTEDNETVVDETVATDTTKDETTDTVEDTKVPTTSDTTPLAIVFLLAMVGCACVLVRRKIIK